MTTSLADRRRRFRELHQSGCFVIPNPWDVGSARLLEQLSFQALATTSSGFAWSLGRQDNSVTLDEALAHIRSIAEGVNVPVNADFALRFEVGPVRKGANADRTETADRNAEGRRIIQVTVPDVVPLGRDLGGGRWQRDLWLERTVARETAEAGGVEGRRAERFLGLIA